MYNIILCTSIEQCILFSDLQGICTVLEYGPSWALLQEFLLKLREVIKWLVVFGLCLTMLHHMPEI